MERIRLYKTLCIGCGKDGSESHRRRAKELCWQCKLKFHVNKESAKETDSFSRVRLSNNVFSEFILTKYEDDKEMLNKKTGKVPSISHFESKVSDKLHSAWITFFKTLHQGEKDNYDYYLGQPNDSARKEFVIRTDTALALFDIFTHLKEYVDQAQKEGFEDGANMLTRLAKGDITTKDFDARIERKSKK